MNEANQASLKPLLRQAGLRATMARIATLRVMSQSSKPLSHAEVAEQLESFGIDKATVYRNLNDLAGVNLLRRAELGDHVWRFELVNLETHDCSPHPHFLCVDCGTVSCVDDDSIKGVDLSNDIGTVTEVLFRGHCKDC